MANAIDNATATIATAAEPRRGISTRAAAPRDALRALVEAAVLVAAVSLLVTTWLARFHTIDGESMAETLHGAHFDAVCQECAFTFACGLAGLASGERPAVCPNCGHAARAQPAGSPAAGDRVLVDVPSRARRPPRRWELVAFREPARSARLCVKRVVGLPGETIAIRDGDVYVNGQIARKSLDEQRQLAILVHDAAFEPREPIAPPRRWRSAGAETGWERVGKGGFRFRPIQQRPGAPLDNLDLSTADWLVYHHDRRVPGAPEQTEAAVVVDQYGYNQTHPVRDLYPVADLLLSLAIAWDGHGTLRLRAHDGRTQFECALRQGAGQSTLSRDGHEVHRATLPNLPAGAGVPLALSLVDQRLLLVFGGATVFDYAIETEGRGSGGSPTPFAIAIDGGAIEVSAPRVFRDIYYTLPPDELAAHAAAGCPLAEGELYVLGDNSPRSHDCRYASFGGPVRSELLIGRPVMVVPAARATGPGGFGFQVPAVTRIRYIPAVAANN